MHDLFHAPLVVTGELYDVYTSAEAAMFGCVGYFVQMRLLYCWCMALVVAPLPGATSCSPLPTLLAAES